MILEPTVLVVGAGAGVPYGLPTGNQLVEKILHHVGANNNTPLLRALRLNGAKQEDIEAFRRRLKGSDAESVDVFLAGLPEPLLWIGRNAIASVILHAEKQCVEQGRFDGPVDDHWLKHLWGRLRASNRSDLERNRLTIITLNYDRLMETYLDRVLSSAYDIPIGEAPALRARAVPILHIHGQLQEREFGGFDPETIPGMLPTIAGGVRVVHESLVGLESVLEQAQEAVAKASRLYFLGFGYHPEVIGRLCLHNVRSGTHLAGSTYGMEEAEVARAQAMIGHGFVAAKTTLQCLKFLRAMCQLS